MNKYMVATHLKDSDEIKWVKVFKDSGEEKYEFIDNSDEKSSSNDMKRINDKYGDFFEKISTDDCISSLNEINTLKKLSNLKIASGVTGGIGIAGLSSILADLCNCDFNIGSIIGGVMMGSYVLDGVNDKKKVKEISKSGFELLKDKKNRAYETLVEAKDLLSFNKKILYFVSGLSVVLSSVTGFLGDDLVSFLASSMGGGFLAEGLINKANLDRLPSSEEDYAMSSRESKLYEKNKKVLSR